jgi:hypothetical protein
MRHERCPYCGITVMCSVGTHIAFTEECLGKQIEAVLFGSESEPGEGGET